eukprot:365116-Chlamydomonas_euryale.AAC.1
MPVGAGRWLRRETHGHQDVRALLAAAQPRFGRADLDLSVCHCVCRSGVATTAVATSKTCGVSTAHMAQVHTPHVAWHP